MTRAALLQLTSSDDPAANAAAIVRDLRRAVSDGAEFALLPEVANCVSASRSRQREVLRTEAEDATLAALRNEAARGGIWLLACLALRAEPPEERFVNRCLLIGPDGGIAARYDKMHMFDVDLASGESWRESNAYRAGDSVGLVEGTPLGRLGLTVCYDIRFPALFEALGRAHCDCIAIPAAFTVPTGAAHWHVLQRARAIEASAFVVAAAQVGEHEDGRRTYGHSLVVDPWGEVLLDMGGEEAGLGFVDVDLERVAEVREQVPSLANRRHITA